MIVRKLIWDDWNIEHITSHNVEPEEVEEACNTERQFVTKAGGGKIRVIAQSSSGKYLTVFLANKGRGNHYVVTARNSTAKEKRRLKKN